MQWYRLTSRNIVEGIHRLLEVGEGTTRKPEGSATHTMLINGNTAAWNMC
jgi:hypothetical protein